MTGPTDTIVPPSASFLKAQDTLFDDINSSLAANAAESVIHFSKYTSDQVNNDTGKSISNKDLLFRFVDLNVDHFNINLGYELRIEDVRTSKSIAQYSFPLNPSSISISNPTTETLEATMKGVYGTNNGAPFRSISLSGTTGVNPVTVDDAAKEPPGLLNRTIEYAFKNTIHAANRVATQAVRTFNAFSGGSQKFEGPLNYPLSAISKHITGFQGIHDLDRFLDYYTAGKKLAENKGWRLYVLMHKDKKYYACALQNWSISKQAGTIEYNYSINLTAYKRVPTLGDIRGPSNVQSAVKANSNVLSNILNGLRQARATVASAHNVMSGIRSDINESFIRPLGEAVLLVGDIANTAKSMYDFAFSGQTLTAMQASFTQYFINNKSQLDALHLSANQLIGVPEGDHSYLAQSAQAKMINGKAEQFQQSGDSSDPVGILFKNPANFPSIFENFPIDDMNLPASISNQLDLIVSNVLSFKAADIVERRDKIVDFSRSISEALGGGSVTYNAFKNSNSVNKTFKKLTVNDIVLLNQLNDIAINMDRLIVLLDQSDSNNRDDYYKFYADYATTQGLRFNVNNLSKFLVPFPMGGTLEQLAANYLGTPNSWIEIAALNGLKSPYIDEDGYFVPVLASSGGDTLTISSAQGMYIGQIVLVSSSTQRATKCKILGIDLVSEIQTILTLEPGNIPLVSYKPNDTAQIKAFAANTVNSDMLIAIPSLNSPTFDTTFKTSPEVDELNGLARLAKIDLLLDIDGDIIITGGGDVKLAYGLTNLVQAAVIKLKTQTNELLNRPNFGNPVDAGISSAEVSAKSILDSISRTFQSDPRFNGIVAGEVKMTGPSVSVSILVRISNTQVTLPVSAELPR